MKVSVITVTLNAGNFLDECIRSVGSQNYEQVEYILIDGFSSDQTHDIIGQHGSIVTHFIAEKDQNLYEALNKGISMATGDVVGILNADDYFPSEGIIRRIAETFEKTGADIVYGNLDYVNREDTQRIIRKWRAKPYGPNLLDFGWMPAHPTFYVRKELFEKYGMYKANYGTSADYELMLRFMYKHKVKSVYLDEIIVKMRTGGISNLSLASRFKASYNDFLAMIDNGLLFPLLAVMLKPFSKLPQFFR